MVVKFVQMIEQYSCINVRKSTKVNLPGRGKTFSQFRGQE